MGSASYFGEVIGISPDDAYRALCKENIRQYGNDYYSGVMNFSNSTLGNCFYSFDVYKTTEKAKKERQRVYKQAEDNLENMTTGRIKYIDLGVIGYQLVTPVITNTKANPKYKLAYVIYTGITEKRRDEANTLTEAKELLKKYALSYDDVYCRKEYVKVQGNNIVMKAETKVKTVKSKPKTIPKNAKLREVHRYCFFGWVKE